MTISGSLLAAAAALFAGAAASAQPVFAQTTAPAATCPRPNVPAQAIRTVDPDMPAIAQMQGIDGAVRVIVSLDRESHVTATRILSSPSAVLNAAALSAARQSVFQTEIVGCRPIAVDFLLPVSFEGGAPSWFGSASGEQTMTVTAQGFALRYADYAAVVVGIITRDDTDPAVAGSHNAAIFDAFRARLRALGIAGDQIRATYTLSTTTTTTPAANPSPAPPHGGLAMRQVTIAVEPAARATAVIDAATASGVTSIGTVRYDVRDGESLYREALANGLKDARARADAIAATTHLRLGPIRNVQKSGTRETYAYAPAGAFRAGAVLYTPEAPAVEARADVTVTYALLKP